MRGVNRLLRSPGSWTTACYGSLLVGQFGPLLALLLRRSWPAPVAVCAAGFLSALALSPKATAEVRAEHARWLDSWSEDAATPVWLGRFFDTLNGQLRSGGRPDPRFFTPLAASMVETSLRAIRRPGYFTRLRARWYADRLERDEPFDGARAQAERVRLALDGSFSTK